MKDTATAQATLARLARTASFWLTRVHRTAIKGAERACRRATSHQCPGDSPGWRLERITSPRFPAPQARGGHESRALQVVGRHTLSPPARRCTTSLKWSAGDAH